MQMRRFLIISILILIAPLARAADEFAAKVDVAPLETVALQHRQTIKTFDSFSRQMLWTIAGKSSIDGNRPAFTVLDMSIRPEKYIDRNLVKIKSSPLRQDFLQAT